MSVLVFFLSYILLFCLAVLPCHGFFFLISSYFLGFFSCWSIFSLVSVMRSWVSCSSCSSYLFHSRLPGSVFLMPNLRICHCSSFFVVYFPFFSWAKCLCGLVVRMLHSGVEETRAQSPAEVFPLFVFRFSSFSFSLHSVSCSCSCACRVMSLRCFYLGSCSAVGVQILPLFSFCVFCVSSFLYLIRCFDDAFLGVLFFSFFLSVP